MYTGQSVSGAGRYTAAYAVRGLLLNDANQITPNKTDRSGPLKPSGQYSGNASTA